MLAFAKHVKVNHSQLYKYINGQSTTIRRGPTADKLRPYLCDHGSAAPASSPGRPSDISARAHKLAQILDLLGAEGKAKLEGIAFDLMHQELAAHAQTQSAKHVRSGAA